MSEAQPFQLPAVAIARLAALHDTQAALAALITVEQVERSSVALHPLADFSPNDRVLGKASKAISALVLAFAPQLAGDVRGDVTDRLVKLGLPAATADAVVDQLTSRGVLSTVPQTSKQQHDGITTLLNGKRYLDGRL